MHMHCRVCNAQANHFARAKILSKYEIEYFRCCDCQFIQTEEPYWIEEAYNHAIIRSDVGLVSRNLKLARITSRVLNVLFPKAKSCIDYGGGFGLLTRLMRDLGHNFSHYDPMAENLFAQGFQASDKDRFDLLTAFEVWEHLAEPIEQIRLMDQLADNWLISTLLVPEPPPKPDEWWYYVLEGGQHISLWSERAMHAVASRFKRKLVTTNRGVHLFSRKRVNPILTKIILKKRTGRVFDLIRQRPSLLPSDHQKSVETTKPLRHDRN